MCVDFKIIVVKRKVINIVIDKFFFILVKCEFFRNDFFFKFEKKI